MTGWINESKTLTKDTLFDCKSKFDKKKRDSDQCWNNAGMAMWVKKSSCMRER